MSEVKPEFDQESLCRQNALHFKSELSGNAANVDNNLPEHLTIETVHTASNIWPKNRVGKQLRKKASRSYIHGVEIRTLPESHFLPGEKGLFAMTPFHQFDIVGEYTGQVLEPCKGGEYAAYLEDSDNCLALGVCAQTFGNEIRTINHFANIADAPNVIMKICYVEELPRVMIVCTQAIPVGTEFLLNYGSGYTNYHFTEASNNKDKPTINWGELAGGEE
jgi:hypothetical protein